MWWVLAFVVGVLAGFQGISERYRSDSFRLIITIPGAIYLATRGALPAGIYFAATASPNIATLHPAFIAVVIGAGAELFLRLRFFVKNETDDEGVSHDLLVGPFDLLRWYQELFLVRMGVKVGRWRQDSAIGAIPSTITLQELCDRVENRVENLQLNPEADRIRETVEKIRGEYQADPQRQSRDQHYKERLAFRLRSIVEEQQLRQLFED